MGFTVSSGQLARHFKQLVGVIAPTALVPILENFKVEVGKGILRTTASDLQTTVVSELPVQSNKEVLIAIPAHMIVETLSSLPEQPVTFIFDEATYAINITTDSGQYRISGESAADFPTLPKLSGSASMEIPGSALQQAIAYTAFAASTEETRPAMSGVYVSMEPEQTTFVATDGHKLVKYSRTDVSSEEEVSFILPRKGLAYLKNVLPNDATPVRLQYNTQHSLFSFGSLQVYCRLIDERFPDYQAAIPLQNPNQLIIERTELMQALRRIIIYTQKNTTQARFRLTASELTLIGEDHDYSNEGIERLPCDYTGDPIEIGFNAKMMAEMLSNLNSNLISLDLSAPNRPGLLRPRELAAGEELLMLAMPIMLNSYVAA